ncbi:MAG: TlpA disulfide reductase family protein [Myxococcota bacterium]|nr:TlpA disulfide reductase family protein [Myxococcota bacterium]
MKTVVLHRTAQWSVILLGIVAVCVVISMHVTSGEERREISLATAIDLNAQLTGGPAPDFSVVRADGSTIQLSQLRGKVVFINFWATWCAPCRAEIPDLEKLAKKMEHVPFEIVAVSSDNSWDDIKTFMGSTPTKMLIGLDPEKNSVSTRYGTEKLPETYVVDRDGRLRLRFVNVQPWTDERIHRYLEWLATSD